MIRAKRQFCAPIMRKMPDALFFTGEQSYSFHQKYVKF